MSEPELRENEARLRQAFEIETVGVIFFAPDGRITDTNNAFLKMSGYSREDLTMGRLRWDLDPNAVSLEAEYTRYIDSDILGKIVLKNFAVNVLGLPARKIRVPISRQGDIGNYKDFTDVGITIGNRTYNVEAKCSRHIVARRTRVIQPAPRWTFSRLLYSDKSRRERLDYELLFAVGVNSPGFEDSESYWRHMHAQARAARAEGRSFDFAVWPHDPRFLERCGIYIIPKIAVRVNQMDITIAAVERRLDHEFFSWGQDFGRLRHVWRHALTIADSARRR